MPETTPRPTPGPIGIAETLPTDEIDTLARRWLDLEQARARLAGEQAEIKARLRHALPEGAHPTPSGAKVTISPNRRFDVKRAEQVIPAELRGLVVAEVIDPKRARENLPPAVYDACRVEAGDPRVVIA